MDGLDRVLMLYILLLLIPVSVALLLAIPERLRVAVHSLSAIPVLTWIPIAWMLLLNVYHVIVNSSGLDVISDLSEPCIEGILGVSLQVPIDFDLHRIGNIEHSSWVFVQHVLLSHFLMLDLLLAFPPVGIHHSLVLVFQGIQSRLLLRLVDVLMVHTLSPLA